MSRKIARIVRIDRVDPIKRADRIELATVGGWTSVVTKGKFKAGDLAVYFEIDCFLPAGNPYWQFLIDALPQNEFEGQMGHVLRSVTMQGKTSQGLLLPLSVLDGTAAAGATTLEQDVAEALGVKKYEKPMPPDLAAMARGYIPGHIPKTDEDRIQGQDVLAELAELIKEYGSLVMERSEKLEGQSTTWALYEDEFRVFSKVVDFREDASNPMWSLARKLDIERKLRERFGAQPIALQGELVGPGVEGNHYALKEHRFYLFRVYLVGEGRWMKPAERRQLAKDLGLLHAPVVEEEVVIDGSTAIEDLLARADGPSMVNPEKRREGDVYKSSDPRFSFKVVSNAYLLNQKL